MDAWYLWNEAPTNTRDRKIRALVMARLIIRVTNTVRDDPSADVCCWKRGMGVDVPNTRQSLGTEADKLPRFVAIDVPDGAKRECTAFLVKEPGDPKLDRMLQRRAFYFDLGAWQLAGAKSTITLAEALAYKRAMPKRLDPNVLGDAGGL